MRLFLLSLLVPALVFAQEPGKTPIPTGAKEYRLYLVFEPTPTVMATGTGTPTRTPTRTPTSTVIASPTVIAAPTATVSGGTEINVSWLAANGPAPYYLTKTGVYRLMADVATSGTAFVILTNGITFDLNGHTVEFNTQVKGAASYSGVVVGATSSKGNGKTGRGGNYTDVTRFGTGTSATIKNGTISQRGLSPFSTVINSRSTDMVLEDLIVESRGPSSAALLATGARQKIHSNQFISRVTEIENRHQFDGTLLNIQGDDNELRDNTFQGSPQLSIVLMGGSRAKVFNNTFSNKGKYTNDFAVLLWNAKLAHLYDNTVDCTAPDNACRGIFLGGGSTGNSVYRNTITVRELSRNEEYKGCQLGGAYGIQLERAHLSEIYENIVIADSGSCPAAAFRVNTESGLSNKVYRNKFTASKKGTARAESLKLGYVDSAAPVAFTDNEFVSNDRWIFAEHITGLVLKNSTWARTGTASATLKPLFVESWRVTDDGRRVKDMRFIDNRYPNAAAKKLFEEASFWRNSSMDPFSSFQLGWTTRLQVKTSAGAPDPNAALTVMDSQGKQVLQGAVDGNGELIVVLDGLIDKAGKKTNLSPYTVSIAGQTKKHSIVVTQPSTHVLTGEP